MVLDSVFPPPAGGGTEGQVLTLGRRLTAQGIRVVVVTPRAHDTRPKSEQVEAISVVRIPYPKIPKVGGAILLVRLAIWLMRNGRRHAAIHAHIADVMAAVSCVVGRLIGRPVVVKLAGGAEFDTGVFAPGRGGPLVDLLRWGLRQATFYQVTSSRLAGQLAGRGFDGHKVRLVPNAIDLALFRPGGALAEQRRFLSLDAGLVGVFVGRLVVEKGLEFFFSAWARTFEAAASVALLVVGSGELEPRLRATVERLGRSRQIRFLGAQREVLPFLWAADFGVLPSSSEGLSNALLEYMAAGLPVLGSRISGTEDLVVDGETGWLFESLDGRQLESRLREIASLPRETLRGMGRRARERVAAHSGLDAIAERLKELYGLGPTMAGEAYGQKRVPRE
jgi:glycosyltransferase involved in cell wall biosynthesis